MNDCNEFINSNKKETKQVQVLKKIIENNDELTISELMKKYDCSRSVLTGLEKKGFIEKRLVEVYRNPYDVNSKYDRVVLNEYQKNAVKKIIDSLESKKG